MKGQSERPAWQNNITIFQYLNAYLKNGTWTFFFFFFFFFCNAFILDAFCSNFVLVQFLMTEFNKAETLHISRSDRVKNGKRFIYKHISQRKTHKSYQNPLMFHTIATNH